MKSWRKWFLMLFLSCNTLMLMAQEQKTIRDLGLWTGVQLEWEFADDYKMEFVQELRLFDDISKINKYISELGLDYRINKNFKLGAMSRFALDRKRDNSFTRDFRYNIDFKFYLDLSKDLELQYRFRYQQLFKNLFPQEHTKREETVSNVRNRLQLTYDLKKHEPFFSFELFREIVVYRRGYFNQMRIQLGDKWDSKIGDFKFALAYEREFDSNEPANLFFARINYIFKLKS